MSSKWMGGVRAGWDFSPLMPEQLVEESGSPFPSWLVKLKIGLLDPRESPPHR